MVTCGREAYQLSSGVVERLTDLNHDLDHFNITAAWLAQLVERQSAVREVEGSSPGPDQHSGS